MERSRRQELLRHVTSPIVAVTSAHRFRTNGMIANSAQRASLLPDRPRLCFYCFKRHYSHELIERAGRFCLHLLHRGQFGVVRKLGFESGRDRAKLDGCSWRRSPRGLPILEDHYAYFECRVANAMDAGASTIYLGEVIEAGVSSNASALRLMSSSYFREHLPDPWKQLYRTNKRRIQRWARDHDSIDTSYRWQD